MAPRRVAALFRRLVAEIRRDRPSLALLFIAPLLVTGLLTFILREGQTPAVHAAIVNEAGPPGAAVAALLTTALQGQGATVVAVPDEAAAKARISDGSSSVAIVLPAGLATERPPTITVITGGLDPTGEADQLGALQKALLASAAGTVLPVIDHQTLYGRPSPDVITAFAPALVAFFIYFFVYLLTGVSFLRERTGGTLERLMATPVARGEIVVGYTLGFGIFAMVQVAELMTWVLGTLDVPALGPLPPFAVGLGVRVAGNPLVAFVVVVLLAIGAVSLGIFLSAIARTELQIIQFIPLVIVPQILLCGVVFPISSIPAVIQPIAPLLPLTYAVDGLREVFIAGAGFESGALQLDLAVLAAFAVFFAAIAAITIRRDVA